MDAMEDKIGSILGNPEMMQKIMSMAQALGASQPQQEQQPEPQQEKPRSSPLPEIDPGMLKSISGLAKQSSVDKNQLALLKALGPYLSRDRIHRLENAMRAARMARVAAAALGPQDKKLR